MRSFLLICTLLFSCVALRAQSKAIPDDLFFKGSLNEAIAKGKAENKRVMVMCSATFCGPCKQLERDVYPTPEFRELRDQNNLIMIYYHDLDKKDPDGIHSRFKIAAYPSFIVLDTDGNEMVRIAGFASGSLELFCNRLKSILQPENTFEARKKQLQEDPSCAFEYIQFLREAFLKQELEETMYKLLEQGPLENYFTERWWDSHYNYVTFINSGVFRYMVDHPKEVIAVIGKEKYNEFMLNRINKMIDIRVTGSHKKYGEVRQIVQFIDAHPQFATPLSRFFKENIDVAESKDGEKLFEKTLPWIKKVDTKTRGVLSQVGISGFDFNQLQEIAPYIIKMMKQCLKYEKDPKAKEMYEKTIESYSRYLN